MASGSKRALMPGSAASSARADGVLSGLQRRVGLVVHRVQLLGDRAERLGRLGRRDVGVDRLLPRSDAREGVRRHVERVRRRRGDGGVAAGRDQGAVGERRHVVAVDDVVGEAGVLRVLLDQPFEDPGRLEQVGVGLVGRRVRAGDRQRVEHLRLDVGRVRRGDGRHRVAVGDDAGALIDGVGAGEERRDGVDVGLLARRRRLEGLAAIDGRLRPPSAARRRAARG